MTQKELLYVEDAIMHENSIINILEISRENSNNEELISFIENEINTHQSIKNNLMNLLGGLNG